MKPVHQQLREYREAKGVTQMQVAERAGKSNKRISAIETGRTRLLVDEFVELCLTGYEVNPAIFFTDSVSVSESLQAGSRNNPQG